MGPVTLQEEAEIQESTYREGKSHLQANERELRRRQTSNTLNLNFQPSRLRKRISVVEASHPVGLYYGSLSRVTWGRI